MLLPALLSALFLLSPALSQSNSLFTLSAARSSSLVYRPPHWNATAIQQFAFRMRTPSLNAVVLHIDRQGGVSAGHSEESHFVVKIVRGRLLLINQVRERVEQFSVNQFVADNQWHTIRINRNMYAQDAKIRLAVDNFPENVFRLQSSLPQDPTGSADTGTYTVTFGGKGDGRLLDYQFSGCLHEIKFGNPEQPGGIDQLEAVEPNERAEVSDGCEDRCTSANPCQNNAQCFEDFNHDVTCDCSTTELTGKMCSQNDEDAITLSGNQYISTSDHEVLYRGYSRIRLDFKTRFPEGVLFHLTAKGHVDEKEDETVTAVLVNQYMRIIIVTPGQQNALEFKHTLLSDGQWHSLFLELKESKIIVKIDAEEKTFPLRHLQEKHYFAPELFIGYKPHFLHGDDAHQPETTRPFIGCLKRIYHGSTNLLTDLRSAHPITAISFTHESNDFAPATPSFGCSDIKLEDLSMALLSPEVSVELATAAESYQGLEFKFRLPKQDSPIPSTRVVGGKLASGEEYKVVFSEGGAHVELTRYNAEHGSPFTYRSTPIGNNLYDGTWHKVFLQWPNHTQRQKRQEEAIIAAVPSHETNTLTEASGAVVPDAPPAVSVENVDAQPVAVELQPVAPGDVAAETPAVENVPQTVAAEAPAPVDVAAAGVPVVGEAVTDEPNQNVRMRVPEFYGGQDVRLPANTVRLHVDDIYIDLPADENAKLVPTNTIYLGGRPGDLGTTGCFKNISLDGHVWNVRDSSNGQPAVVLSQCAEQSTCQDANPCKNGAPCISGVFGPTCDCRNSGYQGKTCQLPAYAQTCADLYQAGERRSGVHLIDLDGSGPLKPVHVTCNMSIQEQSGITLIGHNFNPTEIRDGPSGGRRYDIRYRFFDKPMLKQLIDISKQCRQHMAYRCNNAPLKLGTYTWFTSAKGENVTSIGSDDAGKCSCQAKEGIVCALNTNKDINCNCEADDNTDRVDEGFFKHKDNVPITNMTFLKRNAKGHGYMSLGDLQCDGREKTERTVAFSSESGYLAFATLGEREDISFFFRTNAISKQALLLYQPGRNSLRIVLSNATTITLYITINGRLRELAVVVPKALNNQKMHLVRLEYGHNEVRLTADLNSNYLSWGPTDKVGPYQGEMYIGGYPSHSGWGLEAGLVGCIQGFIRGKETVDLTAAAEAAGSADIHRECRSSCSPNPCKNNAECFDRFGDYQCICANPVAHSGKDCENDINTKVFSLSNSSGPAYVEIKSVPGDVLRDNITLSFRTHRRSGILVYAHDNFHNFVQLHLQDGRRLILTLNTGNNIRTMEVTREGLSDGRWHQLHLGRIENRVELSVDFDYVNSMEVDSNVAGLNFYSSRPWNRQSLGLETITPPRPNHEITTFKDTYVGGVPGAWRLNNRVQGFYGCLRGLRIGTTVMDVFNHTDEERKNEHIEMGVAEGCEASCEIYNPCLYGGMCINRWGDREQPSECDCRNTSFTGTNCTEDVGAHFDEQSAAVVEYKVRPGSSYTLFGGLTISLAFSTDLKQTGKAALLLVQFYEKEVELVIGLNEEGHVVVELYQRNPTPFRRIIPGNFNDNSRHSVRLRTSSSGLTIQVDEHKEDVSLSFGKEIFITYVMVGRVDTNSVPVHQQHQGLTSFGPFVGCISNVRIEADSVEEVLQPLRILVRDDERPSFVNARGHVNESTCALPLIVTPTAGLYDPSHTTGLSLPLWDGDLDPSKPIDLALSADDVPKGPQKSGTNVGMIVGIVCGVFLLLVLIALAIYMCRLRKRKASYKPGEHDHVDENVEEKLLPDPKHTIPPIYQNPSKPVRVPQDPFDRRVSKFIDDTIIPNPPHPPVPPPSIPTRHVTNPITAAALQRLRENAQNIQAGQPLLVPANGTADFSDTHRTLVQSVPEEEAVETTNP